MLGTYGKDFWNLHKQFVMLLLLSKVLKRYQKSCRSSCQIFGKLFSALDAKVGRAMEIQKVKAKDHFYSIKLQGGETISWLDWNKLWFVPAAMAKTNWNVFFIKPASNLLVTQTSSLCYHIQNNYKTGAASCYMITKNKSKNKGMP